MATLPRKQSCRASWAGSAASAGNVRCANLCRLQYVVVGASTDIKDETALNGVDERDRGRHSIGEINFEFGCSASAL